MLQNAYFLAKIGADTAEIELHFAEMLPIGHRVIPTEEERIPAAARSAAAPTEHQPRRGGRARRVVHQVILRNLGCKEGCGLNLNFELIIYLVIKFELTNLT